MEEQNIKGRFFYQKQGLKEIERKKDKIENESMQVIVFKKELRQARMKRTRQPRGWRVMVDF